MKPNLEHILTASLDALGLNHLTWRLHNKTRLASIVRAKQLYCLLAFEEGYSHNEIGRHIGLHRTSVIHHINTFRDHCDIYPDCSDLLEEARSLIPDCEGAQRSHKISAWLARCHTRLLVISPNRPTSVSGYWVSEGSRPYNPQEAFPQITYQSGPIKVLINVTIDNNEKM